MPNPSMTSTAVGFFREGLPEKKVLYQSRKRFALPKDRINSIKFGVSSLAGQGSFCTGALWGPFLPALTTSLLELQSMTMHRLT
jgi:hypothetical protein